MEPVGPIAQLLRARRRRMRRRRKRLSRGQHVRTPAGAWTGLERLESRVLLSSALGDLVWHDVNANGVRDSGEAGVDGVVVNLLDEGGGLLQTTASEDGGRYEFEGLAAGDYIVEFVLPAGFDGFTAADQGGDDAADSDADPATGRTGVVSVASDQDDLTVDAGLVGQPGLDFADFFPMGIGNYWSYAGTFDGDAATMRNDVVRHVDVGGVNTTRFDRVASVGGEQFSKIHFYRLDSAGLELHRVDLSDGVDGSTATYLPALLPVPANMTVASGGVDFSGDYDGVATLGKHTGKTWAGSTAGTTTFVGWELVTVPAGTFTAAKVVLESEWAEKGRGFKGNGTETQTWWLVRDLGLVKIESDAVQHHSARGNSTLAFSFELTDSAVLDGQPRVSIEATDAAGTEAGDPAGFTVYRTGPTDAPLAVSYSVAGTATAGDDYGALPGVVVIPAEETSIDVAIEPVEDDAIEGSETVELALQADAGYTIAIAGGAAATIVDNDGRVLDIGGKNVARYTDANGDRVTVTLKGPGQGQVLLPEADGNDAVAFVLTETTSKSALTVKASGGDRRTAVTDIRVAGSLAKLIAKTTDLAGDATFTGSVKTLALGHVADQHTITVGPPATAKDTLTVTLGQVVDLTFSSQTPLKTFKVIDWHDTDDTADQLSAPWLGKLIAKGDNKAGRAGDFEAGLLLSGAGDPKQTLASAKIAGDLGSGDALGPAVWDITGDVGTIDASKGTVEGWTLDLHSDIKALKLGLVEQAELTFGDAGSITAAQWNTGEIIGESIKSFGTKANKKLPGAAGDVKIDMTLTGSADPKVKYTLGAAKVAGAVLDAVWGILSGDVGAIAAGMISGSRIRAGIDPSVAPEDLPEEAADFQEHSTIRSVTLKGIKGQAKGTPTFADSIVAAWTLGSMKLKVVQTDNGDVDFGLAADTIKAVTGTTTATGIKFPKLSKLDDAADVPGPAGFDFDDFKLVLV